MTGLLQKASTLKRILFHWYILITVRKNEAVIVHYIEIFSGLCRLAWVSWFSVMR